VAVADEEVVGLGEGGKSKEEKERKVLQVRIIAPDSVDNSYMNSTNEEEDNDPILQMRGVGKEIWADTDADEYVRALRANWYGPQTDLDDEREPA
jgi:hypothetical protein